MDLAIPCDHEESAAGSRSASGFSLSSPKTQEQTSQPSSPPPPLIPLLLHKVRPVMASVTSSSRLTQLLSYLLLAASLLPFASGLKFDIQAHPPGSHSKSNERCIRNFVARDTLVVVTATVSGSRGDGQMVNIHVSDISLPIP